MRRLWLISAVFMAVGATCEPAQDPPPTYDAIIDIPGYFSFEGWAKHSAFREGPISGPSCTTSESIGFSDEGFAVDILVAEDGGILQRTAISYAILFSENPDLQIVDGVVSVVRNDEDTIALTMDDASICDYEFAECATVSGIYLELSGPRDALPDGFTGLPNFSWEDANGTSLCDTEREFPAP